MVEPDKLRFEPDATYRVRSVECAQGMPLLITENGLRLTLLGLQVPADRLPSAVAYLQRYVVGRRVIVRFEAPPETEGAPLPAYIYLTNRLFINRKMIEMGLARAARERRHRYYQRFVEAEQETVNGK